MGFGSTFNGFSYSDPVTLELLQARDQRSQEQVWRREHDRLVRVASGILGSKADAETLVADVFTDFFFDSVGRVRASKAIPSYLRIMTIRRAQRVSVRHERDQELDQEAMPGNATEAVDAAADKHALLRLVALCMKRLTPRARRHLKLCFGLGLSYSEAGAQQGTSKQAVGKSVSRSLEAVRRCVERSTRDRPREVLA